MTTFDDRDKGFENKFAHEEELTFKATALCNRMIGMWAAAKMGKTGAQAEEYAKSIVETEVTDTNNKLLEDRLVDDIKKAGVNITHKEIQREIYRLMPIAMRQVMGHTS